MPDTWDREVDTVVVGLGGGGLMAGIVASEKGDEVLVLEKAPEDKSGGNSRVCGQLIFCPSDVQGGIEYQRNLNGLFDMPEDFLEGWATALNGLPELLESYGANIIEYKGSLSPEFPGYGGEGVAKVYYNEKPNNSTMWNFLKETFDDADVEVLYGTPGKKLIQNPDTNEIVGIVAGEDGAQMNIKARKGVLLACGGFENNPEMVQAYLPEMPTAIPLGTPYNTGDGIRMAIDAGADLCHMHSIAGPYLVMKHPDFDVACGPTMATHRFINVNRAGQRFMDEEGTSKHGKVEIAGVWQSMPTPLPAYRIFDTANFEALNVLTMGGAGWVGAMEGYKDDYTNQKALENGLIFKASSIEELAEKIGIDPLALKSTVDTYNENARQGVDPDFGRGGAAEQILTSESASYDLEPLTGPEYYALELRPQIVNTQGGPRRNGKAEILDRDGNPIPRLYSTGELGAMYPNLYNGGGNLAETIAFGNVAALQINALAPWE